MDRHRWLKETNNVVADISDCSADEVRNVARRDKLKARKGLLELAQRIAFAICAVKEHQRIETDEGEAARFLIALGRFEQKAGTPVVDLGKRGHGRLDIRHKIDNQRNEIAAFCEFSELVP